MDLGNGLTRVFITRTRSKLLSGSTLVERVETPWTPCDVSSAFRVHASMVDVDAATLETKAALSKR